MTTLNKYLVALFASILVPASGLSQEVINTDTHRLEEVAEGVYFASGNGAIYTMSNALIIERDNDVVVVDSHITPAAG
ncbi:MAG: hypothetical protein VX605_00320, partial [Pseudomonadota bacterium]|nr:hypothetical protein [Pseudomonadota bacterium]